MHTHMPIHAHRFAKRAHTRSADWNGCPLPENGTEGTTSGSECPKPPSYLYPQAAPRKSNLGLRASRLDVGQTVWMGGTVSPSGPQASHRVLRTHPPPPTSPEPLLQQVELLRAGSHPATCCRHLESSLGISAGCQLQASSHIWRVFGKRMARSGRSAKTEGSLAWAQIGWGRRAGFQP